MVTDAELLELVKGALEANQIGKDDGVQQVWDALNEAVQENGELQNIIELPFLEEEARLFLRAAALALRGAWMSQERARQIRAGGL